MAAGIVAQKDQEVLENLQEAGRLIGLAFQVRDDILDVTADFEELGKTPGKDVVAGKSTYPALLGLENHMLSSRNHLIKLRLFSKI
ncbi:MAG: polyprenyl synthetase family protein [Streptococcus salivarius]